MDISDSLRYFRFIFNFYLTSLSQLKNYYCIVIPVVTSIKNKTPFIRKSCSLLPSTENCILKKNVL